MWTVKLIEVPKMNDFRAGYFPRNVYYKKEAIELKKEIERKGGKAEISKLTVK